MDNFICFPNKMSKLYGQILKINVWSSRQTRYKYEFDQPGSNHKFIGLKLVIPITPFIYLLFFFRLGWVIVSAFNNFPIPTLCNPTITNLQHKSDPTIAGFCSSTTLATYDILGLQLQIHYLPMFKTHLPLPHRIWFILIHFGQGLELGTWVPSWSYNDVWEIFSFF